MPCAEGCDTCRTIQASHPVRVTNGNSISGWHLQCLACGSKYYIEHPDGNTAVMLAQAEHHLALSDMPDIVHGERQ